MTVGEINIMPYRLAENEIRHWLTLFPLFDAKPDHMYKAGETVSWQEQTAILEPFWAVSNSHDIIENTFMKTVDDMLALTNYLTFQVGQFIEGKRDVIIKSYPSQPPEDIEEEKRLRKSIIRRNKSGVWYTITQERDHWDYQFRLNLLLAFFVYQ